MKISGRTWLIVALAGGAALLYFSSRSSASGQPDVVPTSGNDASGQQSSGGGAAPAGGGGADTAALLAALGQQNSDLVGQLLETSHAFGTTSSAGFPAGATAGFPDTSGGSSSTTTTTTDAGPVTTNDAGSSIGYATDPVGTNVGTVAVGGIPYTGYTQDPSSVSTSTGLPANGIMPAVDYRLGGGAPVLESAFPAAISTPAYAVNEAGIANAGLYSQQTAKPVAA